MMEFLASELLVDNATQPGFADILKTQLGTIINAIAFITVAVLLILFGFRPLLRNNKMLAGGAAEFGEDGMDDGLELPDFSPAALGGSNAMPMEGFGADFGFGEESESELAMEDSGSFTALPIPLSTSDKGEGWRPS